MEAEMTKIIPENDARQGRSGWRVLFVLIAALILVIIAWGGAEFYGESIDTSPPATSQAPAPGG
jgi:hypothetical protein